jgi:hypothetical protein
VTPDGVKHTDGYSAIESIKVRSKQHEVGHAILMRATNA